MKTKTLLTTLLISLGLNPVFSQGLTLPYNTGFDSPAEQAGWEQYRTGFLSLYDWSLGGGGSSAPTCLSHDYNVGGNPADTVVDWFVSPPLNFTAPGQLALKVWTSGFSTPFPDNCEVWFGTDDPDPETGNYVLIANLSYMLPQFDWLDTIVEVPFVAENGYIAFKYKTIGAAWSAYSIDDISITAITGLLPEGNGHPEMLSLKASPNPSGPSARIGIGPGISHADLEMYDLYGRKVRTMNDLSGSEVTIERGDLESGIYFLYLKQGGKTVGAGKVVFADY